MIIGQTTAGGTTVAAACAHVRRLTSQGFNDQLAFLSDEYLPPTPFTTDPVPMASSIKLDGEWKRVGPGTILSWAEQTFYVKGQSKDQGGNPIDGSFDVIPGFDGGPDVRVPLNAPLRVNPRFTDFTLFTEVSRVVATLSSVGNGLYSAVSVRFNGVQRDDYYPITVPGAFRVLAVRSALDDRREWVACREYVAQLQSADPHIRIFSDALLHEVILAVPFTPPNQFTDDLVADCGLEPSMVDIPVLGAAAYLMSGQEARRAQQKAQGDPRRAEDVPITAAINSGRDMYRLFQARIDEERARLVQRNSYGIPVM